MDHRNRVLLVTTGVVCAIAAGSVEAEARVIRVPGHYSTIQAAVNAAASGDTVLVLEGTYKEVVTLKGGVRLHANYEGKRKGVAVVIDARDLKPSGAIDYAVGWPATSDSIELVGFTIINDGTAILVRGANHLIADNMMDQADGGYGPEAIKLKRASQCLLQDNRIYGRIEYAAAVRLKDSSNNLLQGNSFEGSQFAVQITGGAQNRLEHNTLNTVGIDATRALMIERSPQTVLKFNTLRADDVADRSATAVELLDSPNTRITNSILQAVRRRVGGAWGIVSQGSSTATVDHCVISAETQAVSGPGVRVGARVIFADPQVVSGGSNFRLLPTSPARDAGTGKDADGTPADLGAYGGN